MEVIVCNKDDNFYMCRGELVAADDALHAPYYHHAINFGIKGTCQKGLGFKGEDFKPIVRRSWVLTPEDIIRKGVY
jgi:hypothetical protein